MIEQLATQLLSDLKEKISQLETGQDLSSSALKAIIESRLKKMNLVTREEFEAQSEVLSRTRIKIEQLEQELKILGEKAET